jgi:bifunctional non-homologous end joining protein LigD
MLQRLHPPGFVPPCLPTVARTPPEGQQWVYEIKHDGFRFVCRRKGDRVRVFSRNARDWADRVPAIVEAMRALPVTSATIDGEGVVCDGRGITDFDRLRSALARNGSRQAVLYGFDVLEIDGRDMRARPWHERRAALAQLIQQAGAIRLSEHLDGTAGATVFRHACAMGLEGIVAKRRDRPYRSGRCADWVKVRNPESPAAMRIMEWE